MARANFNLATDVIVEVYIPAQDGIFILGLSQLDGPDVLAGGFDSFEWQPIQAEVTAINQFNGGTISQGTIYQAQPGTVEVTLQSDTFDPLQNPGVRAGIPIRIRVLDDDLLLDEWTMFRGKVTDLNLSYSLDGKTTIRLQAADALLDIMNFRHSTFSTPITTSEIILETAIEPAGYAVYYSLPSDVANAAISDTGLFNGDIINQTLQTELGWLYGYYGIGPDGVQFESRGIVSLHQSTPSPNYVFSNTHSLAASHYCFNDIQVVSTENEMANSIVARLDTNPAIMTIANNTDSIDLYGYRSIELTANVTALSDLVAWANALVRRQPIQRVAQIGTNPVVDDGTLKNIAQINVGDVVTVDYDRPSGTIGGNYVVSNYSHEINADAWQTTLYLWQPGQD